MGVIDPEVQKIPVTVEGTSGVHNLTYVMFPQSLEAELETFHTLYPYKRIALVKDRRLMELIPTQNPLAAILAEKGITVRFLWLATKQRLNQILYRPIDEKFSVVDIRLSDHLFDQYPSADLRKHVSNPAAMRLAADFIVQEATASLPEIKEIDEAIQANERILASYRRKRYLPDVGASAQADHIFSRTGAGSGVALPDEDSWQVGVNASWSLFPGGEISVRARQLKIDISRLKTQRTDLIQGLELTLRNNVLDIVAKSFNITLSKQAAEAGAKNFDLVQDAYEKGQVSIVRLLDAQNAALTARLAAANAVYEYFISYLNLERSIGRFVLLAPKADQVDFSSRLINYLDDKRKR